MDDSLLSFALSGTLFGLFAGISPGPLLVLVISETLSRGTRAGIMTALAPLITDTPIILATVFLLQRLKDFTPLLGVLSLCGGIYLVYLAYEGGKADKVPEENGGWETTGLAKGFVTNMLSPHPYLFWLTVGTPLMLRAASVSTAGAVLFLLLFYVCIVGSKITVALLVGRYRERFDRYYILVQRMLAAVLAPVALKFLYDGVSHFV